MIDQPPAHRDADTGFRDEWSLSCAYSYTGGYPSIQPRWSSRKTTNIVAHYQLSPGWSVDYSAMYDITNRRQLTQRFAITRDLHCWTATFTREFNPGGEAGVLLPARVKEQHEVFVERGTRTASLGGIQ